MKSPAFQFYADDFIGGTVGMTAEECGAYIRLLCYQWGHGKIPTDPAVLNRVAGCDVTPMVTHKFPDGLNPRMETERLKQIGFRAAKESAGRAGAVKRWSKDSTPIISPLAKGMANDSSPSPSPSPLLSTLKAKPTLEEVKLVCAKTGVPEADAVWFWNKCEGNGWQNGGKPIKSWPHVIASWKAAGYFPSQKQSGFNGRQSEPPRGETLEELKKRAIREAV